MTPETPRCYLTLRCDLSCFFCSNGTDIRWEAADEIGGDEWLARIAQLPGDDIVFTGGEPTLHRDFWQIVRECGRRVSVYSNFARDVDVPAGLTLHWRASFHGVSKEQIGEWSRRLRKVHDMGHKVTATTVYPLDSLEPLLRSAGVTIDKPQHRPPPMTGRIVCLLPRILLGPNGLRYHCVSKLVRHDGRGVMPYDGADTLVCDDATACVACDSIASERKGE